MSVPADGQSPGRRRPAGVAGDDLDGRCRGRPAAQRAGASALAGRGTRGSRPASGRARRPASGRSAVEGRVATATTRLPAANSACRVAAPSGTRGQRSSTAPGAPLMTSAEPVRAADDDGGHPPLVVERQQDHRAQPVRGSDGRRSRHRGRLPQRGVERVAADRAGGLAALGGEQAQQQHPSDGARRRGQRGAQADPASVRVPVLSVNSTSMSPRSSMHDQPLDQHLALRPSAATRSARLALTTAGSSCGVMPTAMARENSRASISGRCSTR